MGNRNQIFRIAAATLFLGGTGGGMLDSSIEGIILIQLNREHFFDIF